MYALYRWLFARKRFYEFNRRLFHMTLRGLGVLNFESDRWSGEKWFIESCAGALDTVIDVGANVGRYAESIVATNPGVRLFAFEPHPVTFKKLEANASRLGFSAVHAAVGAERGLIHLYDYADANGSEHASVYRDVIEDMHGSRSTRYEVPVITLDEFIEQNGLESIELLKIDTEGNEYQVLLGARRAIAAGRIDAIHFEFNGTNVVSRVFLRDFFAVLPQYQMFRMLPDGLVPLKKYALNFAEQELFAYQNVVAARDGSKLEALLSR